MNKKRKLSKKIKKVHKNFSREFPKKVADDFFGDISGGLFFKNCQRNSEATYESISRRIC